jgi:hypothetical protein
LTDEPIEPAKSISAAREHPCFLWLRLCYGSKATIDQQVVCISLRVVRPRARKTLRENVSRENLDALLRGIELQCGSYCNWGTPNILVFQRSALPEGQAGQKQFSGGIQTEPPRLSAPHFAGAGKVN